MKIRISSWVLAGLYIFVGAWTWAIMSRWLKVFSEMQLALPTFTRAIAFPSPLGWFVIYLLLGALVVCKDLRVGSRVPNSVFVIVLALAVFSIATALFLPIEVFPAGMEN